MFISSWGVGWGGWEGGNLKGEEGKERGWEEVGGGMGTVDTPLSEPLRTKSWKCQPGYRISEIVVCEWRLIDKAGSSI